MKASMPKELDVSEDEGSIPSGIDPDDDHSLAGLEDSEESGDDAEELSEVGEDDDDKLSLAESSDAEDLIPLDEARAGLMNWPEDGDDSPNGEDEDEEWTGFGGDPPALGEKRKRSGGKEERKGRKKVRSLPTFASYEDYAKLIEEGPEDHI
jgi:ribosome biogenesis protein MAK21